MNPNDEVLETNRFEPIDFTEGTRDIRARVTKVNKRELASAVMSVRPPQHESSGPEPGGERAEDIFKRLSQPLPPREKRPIPPRQVAPRPSGGPFLQVCSLSFTRKPPSPSPPPRSKLTALRDGGNDKGPVNAEGDDRSTYSLLLAEQTRMMEARAKCLEQRQQMNAEKDAITVKHLLKAGTGRVPVDPKGGTARTPERPKPKYHVTLDFDGPTHRGRGVVKRSKPRGGRKGPADDKPDLFLSGVPIEPARIGKTFQQEKSKVARGGAKRMSPNALGFKIANDSLRGDNGGRGEAPVMPPPPPEEITEILSPRFGPDDRPQSDNEVIIRGYLGLRDDPRDNFDIVLDRETLATLNGHTRDEIARMSEAGTRTQDEADPSLFTQCWALQARLRSDPLLAVVGENADQLGQRRECAEVTRLLDRLDIESAAPRVPGPAQPAPADLRGRVMHSSYLRKYGGLGGEGGGDRHEERHTNSPRREEEKTEGQRGREGQGERHPNSPRRADEKTEGQRQREGQEERHPNSPEPDSHTVACGSDEPLTGVMEGHPMFGMGDLGLGDDEGLLLDTKDPTKTWTLSPRVEAIHCASLGGKGPNPKTVRFSEPTWTMQERICEVKSSAAMTDLSERSHCDGFNSASQLASLEASGSTSRRYLDYLRATTLGDGLPPRPLARLDAAPKTKDSMLPPRPVPSDPRLDVTPNRDLAGKIAMDARPTIVITEEGNTPTQHPPPPLRYTELTRSYADLLSRLKHVNDVNNRYKPKKRR